MFGRRLLQRTGKHQCAPFHVGVLVPTSGAMGLLGPSALACATLARDTWNAHGGLDGREVRLTLLNSGESNPGLDQAVRDLACSGCRPASRKTRCSAWVPPTPRACSSPPAISKRRTYDAGRSPNYLGEACGLGIRPLRTLTDGPG